MHGPLGASVCQVSPTQQRVVGFGILLTAGILSLPVSAFLFDTEGTENWIAPAQLLIMAAVGAAVTAAYPAMWRAGVSTGRRAFNGIWLGLLFGFFGVLVFFFLINGLTGA